METEVTGGPDDRKKAQVETVSKDRNGALEIGVKIPSQASLRPGQGKKAVSKVRDVLTETRRQMWMAQPIFPGLFQPVRKFCLDPYLAIGSVLLPSVIPNALDLFLASCLRVAVAQPIRLVYRKTNERGNDRSTDAADNRLKAAANSAILHPQTKLSLLQPATEYHSVIQGGVSFLCSAISDVAGVLANPKKMNQWFNTLTQLSAYIEVSGIGDELREALKKPLYYGRLLDNFKILNDCQEIIDIDRIRRAELACKDEASKVRSKDEFKEDIINGRRFMRFATAAYGSEMIRSALDRQVDPSDLDDFVKAVAHHANLRSPADVRWSFIKDSVDGDHTLHHFVAVDHDSKSVVLAIRGTLSLSEALVDLKGMSVDFCCGNAHQGIAEMAENIWKESGEKIRMLFEEAELKNYDFVITGHSLGGGAACILNIKCRVEDLVGRSRRIKCYAFAPPPTYFVDPTQGNPKKKEIEEAIASCTAYVNDNDAVPFMSIASVRRLAKLLDAVDNKTEHIWFWKRWRIFHEYDKVPKDIVDAVAASVKNRSFSVDGECDLSIPSRVVVWCRTGISESEPPVSAYRCDPRRVAEGTIFLCPDMFSDHMPERYECALDLVHIDQ